MSQVIHKHSLKDSIAEFIKTFTLAREGFLESGKIYAKAIAEHGIQAREQFSSAAPGVPASTWRRLELIGTGEMDMRLLTASSTGSAALRRMRAAEQQLALDSGIDVLLANGDHLIVQVDAMTPTQVRQVFAMDHIRDLASQRAWLETNAPQTILVKKPEGPAYRIVNGKVRVDRPCDIGRMEILNLLAELG